MCKPFWWSSHEHCEHTAVSLFFVACDFCFPQLLRLGFLFLPTHRQNLLLTILTTTPTHNTHNTAQYNMTHYNTSQHAQHTHTTAHTTLTTHNTHNTQRTTHTTHTTHNTHNTHNIPLKNVENNCRPAIPPGTPGA